MDCWIDGLMRGKRRAADQSNNPSIQQSILRLVLPAGVAPASVRLEDERLVYFGHGSRTTGLMD